ncbi:D-alanine--D-alanine ligase family protein [Pauljensenia hongkongensis]|uniref:D-alanine--D-alanine ligase n=1 Tax=Pauljensenia hongkongensis TaxID=178339 RepID=A0A1D8B195_9ACTO|nr:D-alanine--D-alanine ligase family protein [Pauljensenia hongkongensis]EFW10488.1 D-alanine-D-alanine ligase [Actinomyces sp. oral taxon 178 str. F0338]ERH33865.1 D-ala D-ala ligase protein [Actinomyces sp. oral taxon 877 str. F0543]RKV66356.1 MAG: D-alanine--D-alanine ligase [Actinomyces sp.]WLD79453.1 D-alanine--D-alanine ligase family protein [Schaalia sp. HMT-877]AOS46917.1 D-alanine--D-alanine ligase A [Pauljensenia hongkongensis]
MTDFERPRVLIVFGGRSSEHEVSCATAAGILRAIDRDKWDVVPLGITKDGQWVPASDDPALLEFKDGKGQSVEAGATRVALTPGGGSLVELSYDGDPADPGARVVGARDLGRVDIVLPLLHGPYGEDGTIQGLLEMAEVRYVGCGVASSAVSMDKHLTKVVLAGAGIDVGRWELITPLQWEADQGACLERAAALGFPVFVKPCRAGSSVGISKVESREGLAVAVKEAQNHDPRVIVEAGVVGREVECGVLGGRSDWRSATAPLGEIEVPDGEFYDYEHKYVDDVVGLVCPAEVAPAYEERVRETALRAFDALECEGLARVDFFLDEDSGTVLVNEVNTMPGFTPISMFPQMWAAAGVDYPSLIDALLEEAAARTVGLR